MCIRDRLHFEFLISLQLHGPAEAVYAGISHFTGIRQIRNGHVQDLLLIIQHIIRNLLFGLGKLIV